ncbi:MAG: hypothetical protein PQJ59_16545 [Spirochaetales bacterium]|nr:hypothetical protein [Spirochaetales bacterium]
MDTSIKIGLQDNVSASARKISAELEGVAGSADKISQQLDPAYLERYNQELGKIGESYTRLNQQVTNQRNTQQQNIMSSMSAVGGGVGQGIVTAGTGDYAGGALAGAKGLSGLLSGLGPVGLAASAAIGIGTVGSALSKQYEARSPYAMRISAIEKGFGESIEANTEALREAMATTVTAVSRYGKTFEEGAAAREAYLKSGGRDFVGQSEAAKYSTYYSADMGSLAQFEGMAGRYGQGRALDVTRASMTAQGLEGWAFEEVMGGLSSIFQSMLSSGVVGNISQIGATQAYFAGAGPTFQGALGAQRVQQMNQAVYGAADLGSQEDIFMYRAASRMAKGDLTQTRLLMQGGMTPELFQNIISEYQGAGYDEYQMARMLEKSMGVSFAEARSLMGLGDPNLKEAYWNKISGEIADPTTNETLLIQVEETIRQALAGEMGAGAMDAKLKALGVGTDIIDYVQKAMSGETMSQAYTETMEVNNLVLKDALGADLYGTREASMSTMSGYKEVMTAIEEARMHGVSNEEIMGIESMITRAKGYTSPKGMAFSEEETSDIVGAITALMDAVEKQTEAIKEPSIMVTE